MNKFYFFGHLIDTNKWTDILEVKTTFEEPLIYSFKNSLEYNFEKQLESKKEEESDKKIVGGFKLGFGPEEISKINDSLKELMKCNGKDKEEWTKAVKKHLPVLFENGKEFDVLSEQFSIELWDLCEFMEIATKCKVLYWKQDFESKEDFIELWRYLKSKE